LLRVLNKTKKVIVAQRVTVAGTFFARAVGLLRHSALPVEEALLIPRCQSIHMFFMRFPIDVIFVDKNDCVVGLVRSIKPFRLSRIFFKASYAIEGAVGMIDRSKTEEGDLIEVS